MTVILGLAQRIDIFDIIAGDHIGSQSSGPHDFKLRPILRAGCGCDRRRYCSLAGPQRLDFRPDWLRLAAS
jgi:hypothetical protein